MRDEIRETLKALRSGDEWAVNKLTELGSTVAEVLEAISEAHAKGAIVVETSTGRRSDRDAVDMMRGSLRYLKKGKTARQARKDGGKGGRPRKERETDDVKAAAIWRDVRYATDDEALKHMPGWNRSAAIRHLKPSGRPEGRRKHKPVIRRARK